MAEKLIPTETEVQDWLVSTLKHACHVEYFLGKLSLTNDDSERPHDLVGIGNKYDWETVQGFAVQYRDPKPDFKIYIQPVLNLHMRQYHHKKWNFPHPADKTKPSPGASEADLRISAVDAVCSLLENRFYQGGAHDYDAIVEIAKNNPPHKTPWMLRVISEMMALNQPDLEQIASLKDFPNIGLSAYVYQGLVKRTRRAAEKLRKEQGYLLR